MQDDHGRSHGVIANDYDDDQCTSPTARPDTSTEAKEVRCRATTAEPTASTRRLTTCHLPSARVSSSTYASKYGYVYMYMISDQPLRPRATFLRQRSAEALIGLYVVLYKETCMQESFSTSKSDQPLQRHRSSARVSSSTYARE